MYKSIDLFAGCWGRPSCRKPFHRPWRKPQHQHQGQAQVQLCA